VPSRSPAHPLIAETLRSSAICAARRLRHGIPEARPQRCRRSMDESCGTPQGTINGTSRKKKTTNRFQSRPDPLAK
jgi:hypothetical protein